MDKGGKDPKVLAQAAKHFEKFFTSEVRCRASREEKLLEDDSGVCRYHGQFCLCLRAPWRSTRKLYTLLPGSEGEQRM